MKQPINPFARTVTATFCCANLVLLASAAANEGMQAHATARVTVERLLSHVESKPQTAANEAPESREALLSDQVRMYLNGIVDLGEGRQWCVALSGMPPLAVDDHLLDSLSHHAEPNDNAAVVIATELRRRFPCQ